MLGGRLLYEALHKSRKIYNVKKGNTLGEETKALVSDTGAGNVTSGAEAGGEGGGAGGGSTGMG